jgi:hypothetical protein
MVKSTSPNLFFIKAVLWGIIYFSCLALVYHIRWFIPFVNSNKNVVIPNEQLSYVWYVVQIGSNIIFVIISILLMKLFNRYQKTGFFDVQSLKVFDTIILSCLILALFGSVLTVYNNFKELHVEDWTTLSGVVNLIFRSFTRLLVLKEPQTMYFLLALILWAVKQFVTKALILKNENEAFV